MTDCIRSLLATLTVDFNVAMLKYDVDVELSKVVRLAEIEKELGLL